MQFEDILLQASKSPRKYSRDVLKCFTTLLPRFPTGFQFFLFIHYSHFVFGPKLYTILHENYQNDAHKYCFNVPYLFHRGFRRSYSRFPLSQPMLCFPFERSAFSAFTVKHEASRKQTKAGTCSRNDVAGEMRRTLLEKTFMSCPTKASTSPLKIWLMALFSFSSALSM